MLFMCFLDIAPLPTPPRHHSCSSIMFLLLLFLDTTLAPFQHDSYSCFVTSLLLLILFKTIPFPTPPLHHSCSSYCKYLSTPLQCCCFSSQHCYYSSSFRFVFPPFMFLQVWEEQACQIWFAFFKLDLKVNLFSFFQMFVSWWLCSLFWLSMFFWIMLINNFFLLHEEII